MWLFLVDKTGLTAVDVIDVRQPLPTKPGPESLSYSIWPLAVLGCYHCHLSWLRKTTGFAVQAPLRARTEFPLERDVLLRFFS